MSARPPAANSMDPHSYGRLKSGSYNPYSAPKRPPVVKQPRTRQTRYLAPPPGCPRKLDRVTRSRNALIIALVVFLIAFLICLVIVIIYLPKILPGADQQTVLTFQVISTLKNGTYDAKLDDPTSYPSILMNTTFCGNLIEAVKPVTAVLTCQAYGYSDASPGVKSTMNVTASLGSSTENSLYQDVSAAIVAKSASVTDWEVLQSGITLIPWAASLAVRHAVQLHLLLCWLFLLHKIL